MTCALKGCTNTTKTDPRKFGMARKYCSRFCSIKAAKRTWAGQGLGDKKPS